MAVAQPAPEPHVRLVQAFISGAGFFSDAYDLFVINMAKNVLANIYPQSCEDASALGMSALLGAVAGQLIFGTLADKLGRRAIFVTTISLVVIGALGSATAMDVGPGIYVILCIWQAVLGFGIGGEYPLSATVTSEGAATKGRGTAVSFVFSMQGMGNVAACLVYFGLLKGGVHPDITWRVAFAVGAVPGLATVYWRYKVCVLIGLLTYAVSVPTCSTLHRFDELQMEESSHYTRAQNTVKLMRTPSQSPAIGRKKIEPPSPDLRPLLKNADSAGQDPVPNETACEHVRTTFEYLYLNLFTLAGTAGSWFIFDVVFYANGLFNASVLQAINFSTGKPGEQTTDELATLALGSLIIALIGLPGYYIAVFTIDRIGRLKMQAIGFFMVGVVFIILAAALAPLEENYVGLFIFLYGLTFLFTNWGPNSTTFVIPSESFPTVAKATCHGLSAASGKAGAAIGAALMSPLLKTCDSDQTPDEKRHGLSVVLYICAGISFFGLIWTLIFTRESRDIDVSKLDADFEQKLARFHGLVEPGKQLVLQNQDGADDDDVSIRSP